MSADHIFVYGSLRSEFRSRARSVLKKHASFVGKATFQGKLYKIDWYPGAVESDNPDDIVVGEVYKLKDKELVLKKLDRYEGCSPSDPPSHEFVRSENSVKLLNGDRLSTWIYLYNQSVNGKKRISSGDFAKT